MFFRVLGPVEAERDGVAVDLGTPGERFVLAVLLLEAGRVVPVDRLIELAWQGEPPRTARSGLQVRVSRLRRTLGDAAVIRTDRDGYALDVDHDSVDVHRFRRLVAEAAEQEDADLAVASLRAALGLWRGPALSGVADEAVRQRLTLGLEEARLGATERLAETELRRGQHDAVLADLHRLVAEHPDRERSIELLVRALYAGGQTERALDALRAHTRRLADELGLDPGPRIRELEQELLRGDVTPPAAATSGPAPPRPAQLPVAPRGFRGRDRELAALDALASDVPEPETGVLLLVGMPGVGKTGLALHWAHRHAERFPDGQLFVDLRGHAAEPAVAPRDALAGLLRALGADASVIPADTAGAAAMYRSRLAGRRMLVVLDNAGSAEQVRPLLPGTPGCLVLVTSRQRLDGLVVHEGARRLPLRPLDDEAAVAVLQSAGAGDAGPELVELCGGLPLALRIAAANVAADPLLASDQLRRLGSDGRLGRLSLDDDEAAVRAAFDLSYLRLGGAVRRAFRVFGVVPGPDVTAAALAASLDVPLEDAAATVRTLLRAHLVDQHRPGRFRCHDLLRDYARERAYTDDPAPAVAAVRQRLLDYYVHATSAAAEKLFPDRAVLPAPAYRPPHVDVFDRPEDAVEWLDGEQDNLIAAVSDAARGGPPRSVWELADVLRPYFVLGRDVASWAEVAAAAETATSDSTVDVPLAAQASARLTLGELAFRRSEHESALEHFDAALHLSERADWVDGRLDAMNQLGGTYARLGEHEDSRECYQSSRRFAVDAGAEALAARALSALGVNALHGGRLDEACDTLERAADELLHAGAVATRALSMNGLGIALTELGRFDDARAVLNEALDLSARTGRRVAGLQIKNNLADLDMRAGRYEGALAAASEVAASASELGRDLAEPTARITMAEAYRGLNRFEDARRSALQALDQSSERHITACEWGAMHELACIELAAGNTERAGEWAEAGLAVARAHGYRGAEAKLLRTLAAIAQVAGAGS